MTSAEYTRSNADNPGSYQSDLTAMTDEEVFLEMQALEERSEAGAKSEGVGLDDILAQIALVEEEIERRSRACFFPYKQWRQRIA